MPTKVSIAFVLISSCLVVQAQQETHFTVNHAVKFMDPTPQSTQLFKGIPAIKDLIEDDNYQFAYEDLKGDGTREIIVQAHGMNWCGSGGCLTIILEKRNADYGTLLSVNVGDDLAVMNEKANGYACIRASFGGGMNMKPKVFILKPAPVSELPGPEHERPITFTQRPPTNPTGDIWDQKLSAFPTLRDFVHSLDHRPLDSPSLNTFDVFFPSDYELAKDDLGGDGRVDLFVRRRITLDGKELPCFFTVISEIQDGKEQQVFSGIIADGLAVTNVKKNGHFGLSAKECSIAYPNGQKTVVAVSREYAFETTQSARYSPSWEGSTTVVFDGLGIDYKRVSEAIVVFRNRETGEVTKAIDNPKAEDYFSATHLKADIYDVSISFPGKKPIQRIFWVTFGNNQIEVHENRNNELQWGQD